MEEEEAGAAEGVGGSGDAGPGGASQHGSSAAEADEALTGCLAQWRCSRLLSAGLPLRLTLDPLLAKLREYASGGGGADAAATPARQWWAAVVLRAPTEEDARREQETVGALDEFYEDLIRGRGWAAEAEAWVQRHVGESVFARVGGQAMRVARRAVLAALVRHSGLLTRVGREWEARGAVSRESRPSELLLQTWRAAQRTVEWAVRQKQASGLAFTAMAEMLEHKARFLLQVLPSAAARAVALDLSTPGPDHPAGAPLASGGRAISSPVPGACPATSAEARCVRCFHERWCQMPCMAV
jgi:hypothetical protein